MHSAKYPYPCILGFHHVALMMSGNPIYHAVLESGKGGKTQFLDLGCCSMFLPFLPSVLIVIVRAASGH